MSPNKVCGNMQGVTYGNGRTRRKLLSVLWVRVCTQDKGRIFRPVHQHDRHQIDRLVTDRERRSTVLHRHALGSENVSRQEVYYAVSVGRSDAVRYAVRLLCLCSYVSVCPATSV